MEEKNEGKMTKIKAGSFLIIIFLLLYIPSVINWAYGDSIVTDIVRIGELEDSINTEAFIVRNEEVLESPFEGNCIPEIGEGEKVPAFSNIATVLKKDSDDILEALKSKELEIIKAQRGKSKNLDIFSEDIAKLENEIEEKVKLVVYEGNRNNLLKIRQLKEDIDGLIQKKATIAGDTGSADTYIKSLKQQKENIQMQIRMNTRKIVSKNSGIISYVIDGYENMLRPDSIKDIKPEFLGNIKENKFFEFTGSISVESGKPFAKVIKDLDCYLVVALGKSKADRLKTGDTIDVRLNEVSKTVNGLVTYKSTEIQNRYIFAIRIDKGVSETSRLRKINTDIILRHYKGYRVPVSSLRDVDMKNMKAKIVINKSNYASVRDVTIKGTDEEFAIIANVDEKDKNSIGLYDIYVVRPGNIQEGQMINK
ncbi:MAG: hypothetical protein N3I35_17950 [Clostridia bacterium]|nr:hypothetical protein [Clostridia bacterium]